MKVLSPRLLLVVFCCASWSGGVVIAQTSPKETFKIESESKSPPPGLEEPPPQTSPKGTFKIETVYIPAEDPTTDPYDQQYVVSTADPNIREPLGDKRQAMSAEYFISPDERWIFATYPLGSHMGDGELFKRGEGLKFKPVSGFGSITCRSSRRRGRRTQPRYLSLVTSILIRRPNALSSRTIFGALTKAHGNDGKHSTTKKASGRFFRKQPAQNLWLNCRRKLNSRSATKTRTAGSTKPTTRSWLSSTRNSKLVCARISVSGSKHAMPARHFTNKLAANQQQSVAIGNTC